jgi:hypothetical protein
MKTLFLKTVGAASVILLTSTGWAETPVGVGSAVGSEGPCFSQIVVGPPGNFFPILDGVHGILFVQVSDGKFVEANSATGTAKLTCHGSFEQGQEEVGFDVVTGQPATGTNVGTRTACSALKTFGLTGACRGNGNGAIILNAETQGDSCVWNGLETLDWKTVFTPGGRNMTSCHFKD